MKLAWAEGKVELTGSWTRVSADLMESSTAKRAHHSGNRHWANIARPLDPALASHWADWPKEGVTLCRSGSPGGVGS